MTTTTIELPDELRARAEALAQMTGRSLAEAVSQGLAYDRWFREQVEQALHSTAAGRFASPEDVEAMWCRLTTPEAVAAAR